MRRRRQLRWAALSFNWASKGHRERGEAKRGPVITSTALLLLIVATLETPIISFISSQKQPPPSISSSNDTNSNNSSNPSNNYIPIDQKQQQQRQQQQQPPQREILDGMVTANVVFVNENNNVNDTDADSGPVEFDSDESDPDSDLDTRNTNLLFQSARYRAMLLAHIFNEFNVKNLSLQASANVLGYKAVQAPEDYLRIPASPADLSSSVVPAEEPSASLAQSGRHPPLEPPASRPFFGDVFYSFQTVYWPIHCVICLVICTLGIFANVTNIIVLTRPNMITAVNTILSAMAFSDLIVNISNIPYLIHELGDSSNVTSFYSYQWAVYILSYAHVSVTAHTISIWLTCVLATWRYFVVCRSQSSNQRIWSVNLAKRTIIAVFLFVPVFCIPNYLSFAIIEEKTFTNNTIYKVGFSRLADETKLIKTFHFWIFSCLTKLVPCVLLTFFTSGLIRKLLSARERRLRLATGNPISGKENIECEGSGKMAILTESHQMNKQRLGSKNGDAGNGVIVEGSNINNGRGSRIQSYQQRNSSCATDHELVAISCNSSNSSFAGNKNTESTGIAANNDSNNNNNNQARILTQLVVCAANTPTNTAISTTTASTKMLASCDTNKQIEMRSPNYNLSPNHVESPRSASTCGALELYSGTTETTETRLCESQPLVASSRAASQDLANNRRSLGVNMLTETNLKFCSSKRASEAATASRQNRGSAAITPIQLVKLQAAQRQLSQNETTTRLLIAVMIVFLICEFPAGILAALCAVLGEGFFENVYQPIGLLTDLLALINSSVNFILYCFMSTQFRTTFYKVVLHLITE